MPTNTETKTESKNPNTNASTEPRFAAPQDGFAGFDPMAAWTASQAAFHKMMSESVARAQAWADEYAALEAQMRTRANSAIDAWAQLAHDTINYTSQLSAQARKLSVDAVRKAGMTA